MLQIQILPGQSRLPALVGGIESVDITGGWIHLSESIKKSLGTNVHAYSAQVSLLQVKLLGRIEHGKDNVSSSKIFGRQLRCRSTKRYVDHRARGFNIVKVRAQIRMFGLQHFQIPHPGLPLYHRLQTGQSLFVNRRV